VTVFLIRLPTTDGGKKINVKIVCKYSLAFGLTGQAMISDL
jgi:hypothetical protein